MVRSGYSAHAFWNARNQRPSSGAVQGMGDFIDILFDREPGHDAPRLVDVLDASGHEIAIGQWIRRPDGLWALRIAMILPNSCGESAGHEDAAHAPSS